ncbi:MAG: hypothetical protein V3V20_04095 [Algisphaera sp.]
MPPPRPTTLLAHHAPGGFHYDWLIDPPLAPQTLGQPPSLLWTARVARPWTHWPRIGAFTALALPPHRRHYLNASGPLTHNRGHITTVAQGQLHIHLWHPTHIRATLTTGSFHTHLILNRPAKSNLWHVQAHP